MYLLLLKPYNYIQFLKVFRKPPRPLPIVNTRPQLDSDLDSSISSMPDRCGTNEVLRQGQRQNPTPQYMACSNQSTDHLSLPNCLCPEPFAGTESDDASI